MAAPKEPKNSQPESEEPAEPIIEIPDTTADSQELAAKISASAEKVSPPSKKPETIVKAEAEPEDAEALERKQTEVITAEFDEEANKDTPVGELAESHTVGPTTDPESEFSDQTTAQVVDDIVSKETDEVLEAEDEARAAAEQTKQPKKRGKFIDWVAGLWANPASRAGIIVGAGLLLLLVSILPATRYAILNTFGVRASSSVKVIDKNTRQPLKNVTVSLRDKTVLTDQDGVARFSALKLGKTEQTVTKRGFAELKRTQTLGWGSNPLGETELTATGSQFVFKLTDFLSAKPIAKAEATSGEFSAFSDDKGEINLVVDSDDESVEVVITAVGYRSETVTFSANDQAEKALSLVPDLPQVFVSRRSGKYDVYKIDADGKNETKLLAATGKERDDMVLAAHPTQNYAALVSTRDNKRNKDSFLLSGLFVINVADGSNKKVTESERVQLVDWLGDYLIYVQVTEGTSAANPKRSRLMSYNAHTDTARELAAANYFNDVYAAGGIVYYAPSSYAVTASSAKLYKVNADGTSSQKIFDQEVWSILRADYDTLQLSVGQDWYELKLGATSTTKGTPPANPYDDQSFEDDAKRTRSLWVDERDGKGVLLVRSSSDGKDTTLQTLGGLVEPLRWLNNQTVVYRIVTNSETADYVISTEGGEAKKVTNVTNTGSAESFYYY